MALEQTFPSIINLNVGGQIFTTRLSTLQKYPDSMLAAMFSGRHNADIDREGNYFIDRNGGYFTHILDFLRNPAYNPPGHAHKRVKEEAEYFGLQEFVDRLIVIENPSLTLIQQSRVTEKKYNTLREKILKYALSSASDKLQHGNLNSEKNTYKTGVLIIKYKRHIFGSLKSAVSAASFQHITESLRGLHNADSRRESNDIIIGKKELVCVTEDILNLNGFICTLVYDLKEVGYDVSFVMKNDALEWRVKNEETDFEVKSQALLKFSWAIIPS